MGGPKSKIATALDLTDCLDSFYFCLLNTSTLRKNKNMEKLLLLPA